MDFDCLEKLMSANHAWPEGSVLINHNLGSPNGTKIMETPIDTRQLTFIECPDQDDFLLHYRDLEEIHRKAREAVADTNQKRSEYETSLRAKEATHSGLQQIEFNRATKRAAYVSAALNQWFLRKPLWKAMQKLLETLQRFNALTAQGSYRKEWAWLMAASNNIVLAENLLKEAMKTFSRFSDCSDDDNGFFEGILADCRKASALPRMPLLPPSPPDDNGLTMPEKAKLFLRCVNAVNGASNTDQVQYVAVVDVGDIGSQVIEEVAGYFKTLNYATEYSGGNELRITRKSSR